MTAALGMMSVELTDETVSEGVSAFFDKRTPEWPELEDRKLHVCRPRLTVPYRSSLPDGWRVTRGGPPAPWP